jgi:hypothetical protein
MKRERLKFARAHKHLIFEDWSTVIFRDESTFRTIRSSGQYVL